MTAAAKREIPGPAAARKAMIDGQLRVCGVNDDAVLAAMARVAREDFVPAGMRAMAHIDRAIALGDGHFIAPPLFYGRMLAEAAISPGERALVVDAGSSYLAALAAELGADCDVLPAAKAASTTKRGEYDLLLVDGAVEELPRTLGARLRDGGRVVTGIVDNGVTRLAAGRCIAGEIALLPLAEMGIPRLPEFARAQSWAF